MRVLGPSDPDPTIVQSAGAGARFLITCDHAGRRVPASLGDLGLPPEAFERHIAWDLGAGDLSARLGERLGACVISQAYSRLVIDCNRDPASPDAIPERSDGTAVPGNAGLTSDEIAARVGDIHAPYHAAIARELDRRGDRPTVLVFMHSFTPRLAGGPARPWHAGVLHEGSSAVSRAMLALLAAEGDLVVGDNQPYTMDGTDHSARRHALDRGLDYLELEVRQDLLADAAGRAAWADRLARLLPLAALSP